MRSRVYNERVSLSRSLLAVLAVGLSLALPARAAGQTPPPTPPPVPRPFPGAGGPPAGAKPEMPTPTPAAEQPPAPSVTGLGPPLVYPGAVFLQEFDAGRGQKYFIYGTDQAFPEIVAYYKGVVGNGGETISKAPAPAIQQFDIGRFEESTMTFRPSVVVKDYLWNGSEGYLITVGTTTRRYRTIIQIVPVLKAP